MNWTKVSDALPPDGEAVMEHGIPLEHIRTGPNWSEEPVVINLDVICMGSITMPATAEDEAMNKKKLYVEIDDKVVDLKQYIGDVPCGEASITGGRVVNKGFKRAPAEDKS